MKHHFPRTFGTWIAVTAITLGCGPFFPDTLLDRPQAALAVPPVSYLNELHRVAGTRLPEVNRDNLGDGSLLDQIPLELAELRGVWEGEGVEADEIARRAEIYVRVRTALLLPIKEVSMRDFPAHPDGNVDLPPNPLGEGFPKEVADYVEAARLHAAGNTEEAREIWKDMLGRPPAEKRLRSLWAAWMLAKTAEGEDECMEWYARVEVEAELGGTDALGLRAAAKSWRGPRTKDRLEQIHLLYESFVAGRETAAIDLRSATGFLFTDEDEDLLAAAAADPLVRKLVNIDLHVVFDRRGESFSDENPYDEYPGKNLFERWFTLMEKQEDGATEGAAPIAWALYSSGKYEDSRRWLSLAGKDDALALWLRAKFDLRDGNTEAAAEHLAEALGLRSAEADWNPANFYDESRWFPDAKGLQSLNDGRLLADNGIVSLARGQFTDALDAFREADYNEDAAYVAENVLSADELMNYVRKVSPEWDPERGDVVDPRERNYGRGSKGENRIRWILARRLNREGRMQEAREFIPPDLRAVQDRYIALDKAGNSGKYKGETRAAVFWELALMRRHYGAELFSTEGAPDGGAFGWSFPIGNLVVPRTRKDGWRFDYDVNKWVSSDNPHDLAIPPVAPGEMIRARRYAVKNMERFHYRYDAADLAWEAGKSLPANHPLLSRLYTTAGKWLSSRDPEAADRFYQALVRRCAGTGEGKAADVKRWFPSDILALGSMPALPREFLRNPEKEPHW